MKLQKSGRVCAMLLCGVLGTAMMLPQTNVKAATAATSGINMYRMYNANSGEHFYTGNSLERDTLINDGWTYEGVGWIAPSNGDRSPVYRLYNPNAGDHFYTLSSKERDSLVAIGWSDEGIGWYSSDNKEIPLYREYNPNVTTGTHNYTVSETEHKNLISDGWSDEGISWYGVSSSLAAAPKALPTTTTTSTTTGTTTTTTNEGDCNTYPYTVPAGVDESNPSTADSILDVPQQLHFGYDVLGNTAAVGFVYSKAVHPTTGTMGSYTDYVNNNGKSVTRDIIREKVVDLGSGYYKVFYALDYK